jgi:hypothetical protein
VIVRASAPRTSAAVVPGAPLGTGNGST